MGNSKAFFGEAASTTKSDCSGTASANDTGSSEVEDRKSEETKNANPGGFSESTRGESERNSGEILLESDNVQTYTARELVEKAKKRTKATSAQQTFRVSTELFQKC